MSATVIIMGLIAVGAAMAVFAVVSAALHPASWIERLPWLICGMALGAFAIFSIGGHARRDARVAAAAFRGAAADLRKTEASYRQRTGRWQTDPDTLSLQTGCWGIVVEWVGPAGSYFRGFDKDTEVAILNAGGSYEVVSVDRDTPRAVELDASRDGSVVVGGHRVVFAAHPNCDLSAEQPDWERRALS